MLFQTVIGGYRSLELVSWANGTPAQLMAMLDAHYAGRINIANYWSVGDARTVGLSAIEANNCTDAMSAQTAQLVLMNVGGKTLVNAISGKTTCAFVVGFKDCLAGTGNYNTSATMTYSDSAARQFLNNQLYLSLPSEMQLLFKPFVNATYNGRSTTTTEDLFVLPARIEVLGSGTTSEGSQLSYYATAANRIKKRNGSSQEYWTRSISSFSSSYSITTSGSYNESSNYDNKLGVSPFGVI